jgi:hypothetical protein
MLGDWQTHSQFQELLLNELAARWPIDQQRIVHFASVLEAAWLTNLDPAKPVLAQCYSLTGRPSNQAPAVLRSLLLMTFMDETSIPAWHHRLCGEPILAVACGFRPDDVAPVSTHHYMRNLVWPLCESPVLKSSPTKPKTPAKKEEKMPTKHPDIVDKLLKEATKGRRLDHRPERFLQQLMASVVVKPSAEMGLLGNTQALSLAIDGAPLETGASPRGNKVCTCQLVPGEHCGCKRSFEDAAANWGWDNHHKQHFYGHTLYHVTAADSPFDLAIYVRLAQASRHDSVTGLVSLVEAVDLYPQWTFRKLLADSAHDNGSTYEYCYDHQIAPYIDENKRRQNQPLLPVPAGFSADGVPICPSGELMVSNGFCPGRKRHKYRCPHPDSCATRCSSSSYGRVVYTYPKGSLRQPPVPRNSDAWKRAYKRRTTVERSLKRSLVDRHLEACRVRRKHNWYWCAVLTAMAQHLDAWIASRRHEGFGLLDWLTSAVLPATA